jgi:hypothetical protein
LRQLLLNGYAQLHGRLLSGVDSPNEDTAALCPCHRRHARRGFLHAPHSGEILVLSEGIV